METPDKRFSDFVGVVKSWIPRKSELANASRDFWMPDNSCRVCYDCDSQFTVFNRRHHCRHCGRVFCAKCSSNSIPRVLDDQKSTRDEGERVRVCNFCFKQWEEDMAAATAVSGARPSSPVLSPSLSTTSIASSKSSCTGNSSTTITAGSASCSAGAYQHTQTCSVASPLQCDRMETCSDKQDMLMPGRNADSTVDMGDGSNHFGYCLNRSSDDEDDYSACRCDSEPQNCQTCDDYYGPVEYDDYQLNKDHQNEGTNDAKDACTIHDRTDLNASLGVDRIREHSHENGDECNASSSIYSMQGADVEPVDFENNKLIWLPPEPEDEEDERETILFDDDDEDATGEWGYLRSSNSFRSGEYRSRDRSAEEHKKAMKNIVDGHFRALVAQLLQAENLPMGQEDGKESWLDIITSLSWEAASLLKPDTSKGGGMDPALYVKVKCLACGRPSESFVVKGVVCKKNVAHRRMTSKIVKPRLLILGGSLEYQRVSNLLSSFDTLLQQEMEYLVMAVAKIHAHQPNVLLVENTVSRFAQDLFLQKNISLVLNVKRPLLERISRCTGAQIVPSIDHLSSQKMGHCDLFHVEKFLEEHGSAGEGGNKLLKTLMFFEGCPKPLGCTILLKGASGDELKKVKHVVQYGVFAAYHLALETSFLADEGATLPELPLKAPINVALPEKPPKADKSISVIPGFTMPSSGTLQSNSVQQPSVTDPNILPGDSTENDCVIFQQDKVSLPSLFNSSGYTQSCTKKEQSRVNVVGELPAECRVDDRLPSKCLESFDSMNEDDELAHNFGVDTKSKDPPPSDLKTSPQDNGARDVEAFSKEDVPPSPSDHPSILVSLSSRCAWKGTVCEHAHLFRIKYYGSFDKPLGRFLRDHLFDQSYRCRSCDMPSEAHVHCYTHRQGSLTISVRRLPDSPLPGERDGKIWMWHRCLKCPRVNGFPPATRRVVMSDAAWGLSFGKFLELSFSNHAAASRVASCGHSLHRDCLRFYGFDRMVACFRYASINVHSVYLPPPKLDFNYRHQEWVEKEANEVANSTELLFNEVLTVLAKLKEKGPSTGSLDGNESLQKLRKRETKKGQPSIDILEVNIVRRQLLALSYVWDQRLIIAASSYGSSFEVLSAFPSKNNEKLGSTEKVVNLNISIRSDSKADDLLNGILNSSEEGKEAVNHPNQHNINLPKKESENVVTDGKNSNMRQVKSSSVNNQLGTQESGGGVRRVLSDGQFPIAIDLSDTLDAKWRGENGPSKSLVSVESENMEENRVIQIPPFACALPARLGDSVEDLSSWMKMPFSLFYKSLNKNSGSALRFDALSEYSPVYVSLFRELAGQCGARFFLPIGVNDTVIPIFDDEPTSIISYVLVSPDYHSHLSDEGEKKKDWMDLPLPLPTYDSGFHSFQLLDDISLESFRSLGSNDDSISSFSGSKSSITLEPLTSMKALHVRVSFQEDGPLGKAKYTVTCYYAKCFEALRKTCCPSELDFVRSLSRCKKWGAQGGKSNVFFAKSLDDRFVIKQVTKTELESFIKFAPEYFKYLSESISTGSPTCLAKILGIYQVTTKHLKGGKESRMDVLVMENLLFGRNVTRLYDLKGSSRSRYNPDSSGNNKVLLDQNLIEAMPTSPIFVGNKAKRLLERAVWNDTAFLASIDVMDYSLLVGVDEEKHELVLGIIDFMRQYTWDKHLETWVKAAGILGGPKNASPTVISPKQYKKRFRKAMSAYFLVVPEQWSPLTMASSNSQSDLCQDNRQGTSQES
ncbi:1-phosphatidylinositol-3-phosphate 5-kinase FAB1B [Ananas comosus]|uniref:1-phosphatidylinositol-3-phosphate 5-kinase n=1 Tax=Ananas comosus TaxID=4615 RepID=A0A199UD87_ANACO|nr:1-phosphatidylinositol-3-phosphate 5-kinase FAB1B [Ananas comosus]